MRSSPQRPTSLYSQTAIAGVTSSVTRLYNDGQQQQPQQQLSQYTSGMMLKSRSGSLKSQKIMDRNTDQNSISPSRSAATAGSHGAFSFHSGGYLKLSDPLPLLEKGKYAFGESSNQNVSKSSNNKLTSSEVTAAAAAATAQSKKKKVSSQMLSSQPSGSAQKSLVNRMRGFKYEPDHVCVRQSERIPRCEICSGSMTDDIHSSVMNKLIRPPFDICYVDYLSIFYKKMDVNNREKVAGFKKFLSLMFLSDLKQLIFYTLNRKDNPLKGIEDYLSLDPLRIPKCLQNYSTKTRLSEFTRLKVLGDYEGSNISSCTVNPENDAVMILLRSDTNTKGCLHWFQFTVVAKQPGTVSFQILNNRRGGLFYREGMKIAVLEDSDGEEATALEVEVNGRQQGKEDGVFTTRNQQIQKKPEWQRKCENILYYKSNVDHAFYRNVTETTPQEKKIPASKNQAAGFLNLDFNFTFTRANQRVCFAYSYPYSFSDLCGALNIIEQNLVALADTRLLSPSFERSSKKDEPIIRIQTQDILYKRRILVRSRLGLPIFMLKIAANKRQGIYRKRKRKVIFIVARQHPGETPSSFVCEGLIEFLLSNTVASKFLLSCYIFYVLPMLNPDGVVLGNTRCNMSGHDLNRCWQNPSKLLTPEVFAAKEAIKRIQRKREVYTFCDLHGHSQLMGYFVYGCNHTNEGGTSSWTMARLLPHVLAQRSTFFALEECRFKVTPDRMSTARVTAWSELRIPQSFTIETSFYGYSVTTTNNNTPDEKSATPTKTIIHFTQDDLKLIGKQIGNAFIEHLVVLERLQYEISTNRGGPLQANSLAKSTESQGLSGTTPISAGGTKAAGNLVGSTAISARGSIDSTRKKIIVTTKKASEKQKAKPKGSGIAYLRTVSSGSQEDQEEEQQQKSHPWLSDEEINTVCPGILPSWRDYFEKSDLELNFLLISQGEDPNDYEQSDAGSDSEPEVDLYKEGEWPFRIEEDIEEDNEDSTVVVSSSGPDQDENKNNSQQQLDVVNSAIRRNKSMSLAQQNLLGSLGVPQLDIAAQKSSYMVGSKLKRDYDRTKDTNNGLSAFSKQVSKSKAQTARMLDSQKAQSLNQLTKESKHGFQQDDPNTSYPAIADSVNNMSYTERGESRNMQQVQRNTISSASRSRSQSDHLDGTNQLSFQRDRLMKYSPFKQRGQSNHVVSVHDKSAEENSSHVKLRAASGNSLGLSAFDRLQSFQQADRYLRSEKKQNSQTSEEEKGGGYMNAYNKMQSSQQQQQQYLLEYISIPYTQPFLGGLKKKAKNQSKRNDIDKSQVFNSENQVNGNQLITDSCLAGILSSQPSKLVTVPRRLLSTQKGATATTAANGNGLIDSVRERIPTETGMQYPPTMKSVQNRNRRGVSEDDYSNSNNNQGTVINGQSFNMRKRHDYQEGSMTQRSVEKRGVTPISASQASLKASFQMKEAQNQMILQQILTNHTDVNVPIPISVGEKIMSGTKSGNEYLMRSKDKSGFGPHEIQLNYRTSTDVSGARSNGGGGIGGGASSDYIRRSEGRDMVSSVEGRQKRSSRNFESSSMNSIVQKIQPHQQYFKQNTKSSHNQIRISISNLLPDLPVSSSNINSNENTARGTTQIEITPIKTRNIQYKKIASP